MTKGNEIRAHPSPAIGVGGHASCRADHADTSVPGLLTLHRECGVVTPGSDAAQCEGSGASAKRASNVPKRRVWGARPGARYQAGYA